MVASVHVYRGAPCYIGWNGHQLGMMRSRLFVTADRSTALFPATCTSCSVSATSSVRAFTAVLSGALASQVGRSSRLSRSQLRRPVECRASSLRSHFVRKVSATFSPLPVRRALFLFTVLAFLASCGLFAPELLKAIPAVSSIAEGQLNLRAGLLWLVKAAGVRLQGDFAAGKSRDLLVLLLSAGIGLPLVNKIGVSSKVLAFLAIGIFIGPSGFALISDVHWSEMVAEVGIIFFLCEMGLELSFDRLQKLQRDVFGLGLAQFVGTAALIYGIATAGLGLDQTQAIILGAAFSLSSSAFVLQLLDDAKERGTKHGRSAFGILLFQDLVVPFILVLLPMLSTGGGQSISAAIKRAGVNALLALSPLILGGRFLLVRFFSLVEGSGNTVALRALSFFTVLGMCYMFQVFSLSNTLGAFLAGVLLSETAYREQVEAAIAPIREDLLGLFFITVGFGIDLSLVLMHPLSVLSAVSGLLLCKAAVTCLVCRISGLSLGNSQHVGFLLCQAGEFAFVMFGIASEVGAFTLQQTKLLLTVTSVSMACTPFLAKLGRDLSASLQSEEFTGGAEANARSELCEKIADARIIICGYDRLGKLVSDLLDQKFIRWVALDVDSQVVMDARSKDLPVFLGDLPEAACRNMEEREDIILDSSKIAVVTPAKSEDTIRIVRNLRQHYPKLTIIARAMTQTSARRIRLQGAEPIVPGAYEDTFLMNLPIGATVLKDLGVSDEDAEAVVDDVRREVLRNEGPSKGELAGLAQWYAGEQMSIATDETTGEATGMP